MGNEVTPATFREVAAHLLRAAAAWDRAIAKQAAAFPTKPPIGPNTTKPRANVINLDSGRGRGSVIKARACPTCRASVGRPCRAGGLVVQPHRARKNA